MSYDRLEAARVLATVQRLERRIGARFPERGLHKVSGQLVEVIGDLHDGADQLHRRLVRTRLVSRILGAIVVIGTLVALILAVHSALTENVVEHDADWLPLVESTVNDVVFAGLAIFFVWNLPERSHRKILLALLHRLRSLAHVIDMHQLTKDPERLRPDFHETAASVPNRLDPRQMESYLDYCGELLSMVAKTAALVAEESQDPLVISTISDIETLTTGMTRTIWQKIDVLARLRDDPGSGPAGLAARP